MPKQEKPVVEEQPQSDPVLDHIEKLQEQFDAQAPENPFREAADAAESDLKRNRKMEDGQKPKSKRPMTSPWAFNRWHKDGLALQAQDPNWIPRWAHPEKVEQHLFNGARLADVSRYKGRLQTIPGEDGQLTTRLRYKGLVLMEFPKEVVEDRQRLQRAMTDLQVSRPVEEVQNQGGTYGKGVEKDEI